MHCRLYYTLKNSWIDGFLTKHRLYTYLLHQKKFFFDVLTKKTILKIIQWCVLYCPTYLFNSNYLIMSHLKVLLHVSRSWSGSGYSGKHWERGLWAGIHTGHGVNSLNSLKIRSIVFAPVKNCIRLFLLKVIILLFKDALKHLSKKGNFGLITKIKMEFFYTLHPICCDDDVFTVVSDTMT